MATITIHGEGEPETLSLGSFLITVGRSTDSNVICRSKKVAREHALIGTDADGYYVEDLGTKAGTFVNGSPIRRTTLNDGDRISVGEIEIHFENRPQARTPSKTPTMTSQRPAATTPGPEKATADDAVPVQRLEEMVSSIQSHRHIEFEQRLAKRQRVLDEWGKVITAAEQLRQRIGQDPRVLYFGIDRKAEDVMLRVQRNPEAPQRCITLALNHPQHNNAVMHGIWLIRTDEDDRCLEDAQAIINELLSDLARLLA